MMSEERRVLGDSDSRLDGLNFGTKNEGIQVTPRGYEPSHETVRKLWEIYPRCVGFLPLYKQSQDVLSWPCGSEGA